MAENGIQAAVKRASSLTYVSQKLDISRPSLYKYMEMYDSGDRGRVPQRVLAFLDYVSEGSRSDDDVILYFLKEQKGIPEPRPRVPGQSGVSTISGRDRFMVLFPDVPDPSAVIVDVMVDDGGHLKTIGEYRPEPGRRFVTIDDLVPGHTFLYAIRSTDGSIKGLPVSFVFGKE